ncbi:MAG: LysM peptidoglycan-binding domain-containing protein [Colwellia sp.]|nr:LysM peptidoglycan-binding domain-containing protein [Colwellia sp.]
MIKFKKIITITGLVSSHVYSVFSYAIAQEPVTGLQLKGPEITHTVRSGESLSSIAKRYNVSVEKLKRWNNIADINNILLGQKIKVIKSDNLESNRLANNKVSSKTDTKAIDAKEVPKPITLLDQAKSALTDKNYALATTLLTRLYQQGSDSERQFALEFLGVSREKKGQLAFAKQAYQLFLKNYPEVDTASRVKIRLNNLIGIQTLSKNRSFKENKKSSKRRSPSYVRGSLATDYRQALLVDNQGNSRDTLSLANVDVDAKGHAELDDYDLGFRVSVGHYQDLLPDSDKTNEQIRYLNFSASSEDNLYQVKIGRQRSRGKGIFGRFDGVILSSEFITDMQVNVVAGYPVSSSKVTELDPERKFYGLSLDIEDSWQSIDFSLFLFEQSINDLTDRRAVGGELSYFKNSVSVYSLVDYDIFFNELNALLFSGSYSTESAQRYSWSLNYRKNPYVGTRNALIGQSVDSFAELQNLFINDEEILDLALDRTLTSKTASLQFFQPINERYDVSASITWMDLSSAPESGGVPAISQSGGQYYANTYLSVRNLYSEHDTNSFGFRYSDLAQSQVYSLYATSRYRFTNGISITPKLRFDTRSNDNGTSQQSISPTFRMQYQSRKHYIYGDFGGIFYNTKSSFFPAQKTSIYFLYLGYRYYFGS